MRARVTERGDRSARRRDSVSGVVLVIAVVLLGAGRALTRLGAALSPSQSPRWSAGLLSG